MVEAFLVDWLCRYVLPGGPEDDLNLYVFPLAILIAKGFSSYWARSIPGLSMLSWMSMSSTDPTKVRCGHTR